MKPSIAINSVRVKALVVSAATVSALVCASVTSPSAVAEPVARPNAGVVQVQMPTQQPDSELAGYTDEELDRAAENIGRELELLLESVPESLQGVPLNDPSVQSELEDPQTGDVQTFGIFSCSVAVAQAALAIGFPAAKVYQIAREFGGITSFVRIVFTFIRSGTFPANASAEAAELIVSLSGVGGIIAACL